MMLTRRRLLQWSAALAAAPLAACGRKEDVPAAAPASASASAAEAASAPAAAAAVTGKPLEIGFVYLGPVGDAGWTYAHERGRQALIEAFGDRIRTTYVENVPESGAEAERVFLDLASQGKQLIFGTSFGYMEPMLKIARQFPEVRFEHATGYKTASNLGVYAGRMHEPAFLAGVIAGQMTRSNVLGFVGAVPIPEVIRNINAFTLGARAVNPKAVVKVVWVNKWFDPGREREAAGALAAQHADVLIQNTDSPAVLQYAEEKGLRAFGWDSDMSRFGPRAHLASAVFNWGVYYKQTVGDLLAGRWQPATTWWGIKQEMNDLVSLDDKLPAAVRASLASHRQAIVAQGNAAIFRGPLQDNTGKTVLAAGASADDAALLAMNYYVAGVEGRIPA
ncbi:BMP family ABC transporter substrate-binding protein [Cupriavidus sp. USMAHM13]|uniref:BMP family ABC transporter substrate-binding protein n=1 Tax=Cupriavidus sp. USMAHM13 TaxID=1389192 RepID=UPI0008A6E005|nr:BMP family ABC transporter substrate-binding protein [Cupriavidus sp. USMAHM13]AOY98320.1 BMP family ABC transporter substrate-binding protein [Cupriavidus sp. USMAHM13]